MLPPMNQGKTVVLFKVNFSEWLVKSSLLHCTIFRGNTMQIKAVCASKWQRFVTEKVELQHSNPNISKLQDHI